MPTTVSMTTFMDFIVASGTKRITCIAAAKKPYGRPYHPSRDFYRPLRDGIVQMHQQGHELLWLDSLLEGITDAKKLSFYPKCIEGYKKALSGKSLAWISCTPKTWKSGGLEVRVNPELGLVIDDLPHAVKLYFKAETLSQAAVEPIVRLIDFDAQEPRSVRCRDGRTARPPVDAKRGKTRDRRSASGERSIVRTLVGRNRLER